MMRAIFLLSVALTACTSQNPQNLSGLPQVAYVREFSNCYNAVGFFMVEKKKIEGILPKAFAVRDAGEILGDDFNGYASVALIHFACAADDGTTRLTTVVATPIEAPSISDDLRDVRWNWYEFGRLTSYQPDLDTIAAIGMAVQKADLSNVPFHEGDTTTSFSATVNGKVLLQVGMTLTDSVNFEAQSHRLWQENGRGQLISTRWDFKYHHSWIGKFNHCSFDPSLLTIAELDAIGCSGIGITEAIEAISFKETMIVWR